MSPHTWGHPAGVNCHFGLPLLKELEIKGCPGTLIEGIRDKGQTRQAGTAWLGCPVPPPGGPYSPAMCFWPYGPV